MNHLLESRSFFFAILLLAAIMAMIEMGRRVGARRRPLLMDGGASGINAVEAAIFTLLGLLIAFTFHGAAARFDARRELIVREANDIGTAWLRIDLLPPPIQPRMRDLFRSYLDSRLATYHNIAAADVARADLERSLNLQTEIWNLAIQGRTEEGQAVVTGVLPALNAMFDIVTTRTMAARNHPPAVVFAMLALMACASAFLAGHGMSGSRVRSWVHSAGYAVILAVTVFVILDLEFPRLGLIRVDPFDQVLVDLRNAMN